MLESAQIRAARALLNWSQVDLARASGVGHATIKRIEASRGAAKGNVSTFTKLERAFERAGIRFIDADAFGGIGVRLEPAQPKGRGKRRS
jgi:transcriptional regulator with XRE-family HTH domain